MTQKNKRQFGIWMDSRHAIIVGKGEGDDQQFAVIAHASNAGAEANSSEKNEHNNEKTLRGQFYKEILSHMQNAEEVHITGPGTEQEQFMHFMAETPQFKNTKTSESTSTKMSDESLVELVKEKF